jgi:DNA-directed RNA polymerase specialized sigma24 family protein
MTPAATAALSAARRHASLLEKARVAMLEHAQARRAAILTAHQDGLSIRAIAEELGCSPAVVQTAVRAAREDRSRQGA